MRTKIDSRGTRIGALLTAVAAMILVTVGVVRWQQHDPKPIISKTTKSSVRADAKPSAPPDRTAKSAAHTATNEFAYRLTNTAKTVAELKRDPRAVLLQNAFLDTTENASLNIPEKLKSNGDPGAYIVQSRGSINREFRAVLTAAGAKEVSYIPNNALLVEATEAQADALRSAAVVAAVIPYEPYFKISDSLAKVAQGLADLPTAPEYRIAFLPGHERQGRQILAAAGWNIIEDGQYPVVRGAGDWMDLAANPILKYVQLNYDRVSANDLARVTMGISVDTIVPTNYMNLTGQNVLLEINDSGVDQTHPDLSGRLLLDTIAAGTDTDGHGTHVAGIIMGNGTESGTINQSPNLPEGSVAGADFRGKAQAASLYVVGDIYTAGYSDDYLQEAAARTNALISNNSWGNANDYGYDLSAASYDAATRDALPEVQGSQPVLFVFAAGNNGGGSDTGIAGQIGTVNSPGTAKDVLTVGAVEQMRDITNEVTDYLSGSVSTPWLGMTDDGSQVASFSGRGNVGVGTEGDNGRFKPDMVAPGTFVVSTRSQDWDAAKYFDPTNYFTTPYTDQSVGVNGAKYYAINVPFNAVSVSFVLTPNANSLVPFPGDIPLYVSKNENIDIANPSTIDFTKNSDSVTVPPDAGGAIAGISSLQGNPVYFGVGNNQSNTLSYDLTITIATTNTDDSLVVLSNMDATLAPYYRYESGTSMSAGAVAGMLALIEDYFTNRLNILPSPALLKAMAINGARPLGLYGYMLGSDQNYQGWGLAQLPSALQPGVTNVAGVACSEFFMDQSPTNALTTSQRHNLNVSVQSEAGQEQSLRLTLVWTDPPGDPAAAVKLVNDLDLVVTNLDTGDVYYGNDFPTDQQNQPYSQIWNTNTPSPADNVNNVENIVLPPFVGTNFTVSVVGHAVNVNAVTAHTNDVVQDFALVIACGDGTVSNAMVVTDLGITSEPTTGQRLEYVLTTNAVPLINETVGASSPMLGTNQVSAGGLGYGANAVVTIGETNQWHFYVVTNNTDFTNAAFLTFSPDNLSVPRMGVFADSTANATRPEADIDLYVSTNSALTNLSPVEISNCVYSVGDSRASLSRGGTEFVVYSNATPKKIYYIGVKSEDQMSSEYGFIPIFSQNPFSALNPDGTETVRGTPAPQYIPDGSTYKPGKLYMFGVAIYPMTISQVVVSNLIYAQNMGDLVGELIHGTHYAVLNNHSSTNSVRTYNLIYDDYGTGNYPGSHASDGPGTLRDFTRDEAAGPWELLEADNAAGQTNIEEGYSLTIVPHQDFRNHAIVLTLQPGAWFYDYVDVGAGYTNLTVVATNISAVVAQPPSQLYTKFESVPALGDADVLLNNGSPPGNDISVGPPLALGRYYVGLYNPTTQPQKYLLEADLVFDASAVEILDYTSSGTAPIVDDAVTYSSIFVPNTNLIEGVKVGLRVSHPRISDVSFHLVAPDGTRYLLMENRGGLTTNGAGTTIVGAGPLPSYRYLWFTEDTNFATTPIKFAPTPFTPPFLSGTTVTNGFETVAAGNYMAGQTIGGMTVDSGQVSVVDDPANAYQGSNFLALADGNVSVPMSTVVGQTYTVSFAYRGPGSVGLWRGENNANDSILGNTGTIESSDFGTGQVNDAFHFSGTGGRVYVPDIAAYDTTSYTYDFWMNTVDGQGVALNRGDARPGLDPVNFSFYQSAFYFSFSDPAGIGGGSLAINIPNVTARWIHIAGTIDANSGQMVLYTNGVVAASTNTPLRPILTLEPGAGLAFGNNGDNVSSYPFNGLIDEVTAYNRALSASEIQAIYNQGVQGHPKYDLAQPFPQNLAEAQVTVPGITNITLFGQNANWQVETFTFKATAATTVITLQGVEPGMLIDQIVSPQLAKDVDLYYLPEQPIDGLIGQQGYGTWQLEMQDSRVGAGLTNSLDSWDLEFTYGLTDIYPSLVGAEPLTNTTGPNSITWYSVNVPTDASFATNMLVQASGPVNFLYSTNTPPTVGGTGDQTLQNATLSYSTVFSTNAASQPVLKPGSIYYLGVQNTGGSPVTSVVQVDFDSTYFGLVAPVFVVTPSTVTVSAQTQMVVTNAAVDVDPFTKLTYSLINPPSGMSISTNGVITWTPSVSQAPNTYVIVTAVTNSENPPLGATNQFTVMVTTAPAKPALVVSSIVKTNIAGVSGYLMQWTAPTNMTYQVKWANSLSSSWLSFTNQVVPAGLSGTNGVYQFFDDGKQDGGGNATRFYRVYSSH